MPDYFEAPEADIETGTAPAVAGWILWLSLALFVIATLMFLAIQLATPSYERLFMGFGADLPTTTRFGLVAGKFAMLFAVVHALPLVRLWRSRKSTEAGVRRDFGLVIGGFVFAFFALFAWGVSMYMPIFKMGAVV